MNLAELIENHQYLIKKPISADCSVSVVIPVRNEAEHLAKTLRSLVSQVDRRNRPLNPNLFEIIIFANNCRDDSAAVARRWQISHPTFNIHVAEAVLPKEQSNIGFVRRRLMNEAYLRLCRNHRRGGVIMTTDGDTTAASNWITANLYEIENGAEAVGGRILIDAAEIRKMDGKAQRFHLLDTGYRLSAAELEARIDYVSHDYLPRHHQHFNGSFAVTTEAFRRAGGIPAVRFLEDVAFYHSLLRVDARFRHSPAARVSTSARRTGRTESGLSTQINEWTIMGRNLDDYFVESAQAIGQRIHLRKKLRDVWNSGNKFFADAECAALADKLFVPPNFLRNERRAAQTFGGFLEKIYAEQTTVGEWKRHYPPVTVEKSLSDLRQILEKMRREPHRKAMC